MHTYIRAASPWLNPHLRGFIQKHVPGAVFYDDFEKFPTNAKLVFQYCDGWNLNRNFAVINSAGRALINAYPNSDALARKDCLSCVVEYWVAKRPGSILATNSPLTVRLSLDYAEYVDEALTAADNLALLYSLEDNEGKSSQEREWWILKPALVDCGAGIRLFSTIKELESHLELASNEIEDEDDPGEEQTRKEVNQRLQDQDENAFVSLSAPGLDSLDKLVTITGSLKLDAHVPLRGVFRKSKKQPYVFKAGDRIPSSEMREFVAQRYITSIMPLEKRKWHIRAYVIAIGRLKVYVFREMLALLASVDYEPPWLNPCLKSSLTNTALQDEDDFINRVSMRDFWALPDNLLPVDVQGRSWKEHVFRQVCDVSSELFRSAVYTMADKFTTLDNCFELFGVDFLVDRGGTAWLLEVNETPAFYHQGVAGPLSLRLMESVVCVTMEHMGFPLRDDQDSSEAKRRMVEVLDETVTLAQSNITEILTEM